MTFPQRGTVRMLFDPIEEIELDAALARGNEFRAAKNLLLAFLAQLGQPRSQWARPFCGLARHVDALHFDQSRDVPVGFKAVREYDRHAYLVMPLWVYWPAEARFGYWLIARTLVRLGLLQGPEGELFSRHHWSRRPWESQYARIHGFGAKGHWLPYHRWYQFWRYFARDWSDRMPSWADELQTTGLRFVMLAEQSLASLVAQRDHVIIQGAYVGQWAGTVVASSGGVLTVDLLKKAMDALYGEHP